MIPFIDSFIDKAFASAFPLRHDGSPALRYPSPTSFGLQASPFSFLSGKNRLNGFRYSDGSLPKALVVFFHGALAGHMAYSQLIASIVKQGYLVYAYDYTGCMISEGRDCNGMAQPLLDQKAFFEFLKTDVKAKGLPIYAIGHSWGGYCALGCLQKEYGVSKVICLSGFNSVAQVAISATNAKSARALIRGYLKRKYGPIGLYDGLEELKKTEIETLCISGDSDDVVPTEIYFRRYQKEAGNNPHVHFHEVKDRGHQCYWTKSAQDYYLEVLGKKKFRETSADPHLTLDYSRLLREDPTTMKAIFDFFAS